MTLLIFVVVLLVLLSIVVGSGLGGSSPGPFPWDPPFFPRIGDSTTNPEMPVMAPTPTAPAIADPVDTEAGLAEVRLAAGLMNGKLSVTNYQQAMAQLAAADASSRPIVVPPERTP